MQDLKEEIARIEGVVTRGTQQQIVALSREERQNTETVVTAISQVVDNIVSNKLEDIVANEISNAILPGISSTLSLFSVSFTPLAFFLKNESKTMVGKLEKVILDTAERWINSTGSLYFVQFPIML